MKKILSIYQTHYNLIPYLLTVGFIALYSVLSIIRHQSFDSFGFDLGIVDQTIWHYSQFQAPITTIQFYVFTSKLTDHVELLYGILSPLYWIWSDARLLLIAESLSVCIGSLAIYFLANHLKLKHYLSLTLQLGYLLFYGVQHTMWFDVHNVGFASGFIAWYIYALHTGRYKLTFFCLLMTIIAKENLALLTGSIAATYLLIHRSKLAFVSGLISLGYLLIIFGIYFPFFTTDGYRYASDQPKDLSPTKLIDSSDKQQVWLYTLAAGAGIPLLNPLTLVPVVTDLFSYFVLADHIKGSHGLFMHYRVTLAPLLWWSVALTLAKFHTRLNNYYIAATLFACTLGIQYFLHLPLSYLSKPWFWQNYTARQYIHSTLHSIPAETSIVTQNNLVPHLSARNNIFVLWPEENYPKEASQKIPWLRWSGQPALLIVNLNSSWDIRHLLMDPTFFQQALTNMEEQQYIKRKTTEQDTIIYEVLKQP